MATFELFTDSARRVLVLGQEEATLLGQPFLGTEHILLGLIQEDDWVAAKALDRLGVSLEGARSGIQQLIGTTPRKGTGSPPFTDRAKNVLVLALREAQQLGHNYTGNEDLYIGPEHLLLGLVQEGEGVASRVLIGLGAGLDTVRATVLDILGNPSTGQLGEPGDDQPVPNAPPSGPPDGGEGQ